MKPQSIFEVGDYVRITLDTPCADVTGVVREKMYSQHVNRETGSLVDVWSWGYMVEFARGFPVYTDERFLRKARLDE
jgi:hypothetical protein